MAEKAALPVEGWTRDQLTVRRAMPIQYLHPARKAQRVQIKHASMVLKALTWAEEALLEINELATADGGAGRRDEVQTAQRKLPSDGAVQHAHVVAAGYNGGG